MAFKTEDKKIAGLLDKRVYLIPRNQRHYVWTDENWKDLLEDLSFSITNASRPHFLGSIVLEKKGDNEKGAGVEIFSIIDGQQRITTILLFLSVVMLLFKEHDEKEKYEGLKSYLLTTNLSNQTFIKLETDQYPYLDGFIRRICGSDYTYSNLPQLIVASSSAQTKGGVLFKAIQYFYAALSIKSIEEVEKFRDALLNTNVVEIIATSEEDAYTIFEILNARGQILEDYELIKNYIMRYYEPQNDIDKAKIRWENEIVNMLGSYLSLFIKHYVTHRYAKSGNAHNFNYSVIKGENPKNKVVALLDDLCRKASYYQIIADPRNGDNGNCSECEYRVFSFMKTNRGVLFRPVFLSLLHRKELGDLSTSLYERILEFIKLYFICYTLLGRETSNKLADTVQSTAKKLEDAFSLEILKDFVGGLIRRLPTQAEFVNTFKQIGWSKINGFYKDSMQKKRVQVALSTLEAIETGIWETGEYTIEHLNPDSDSRENANIGNLVLLESNFNESNKDKPFAEKVETYVKSRFITTRNVYWRYKDTPSLFKIETRAKLMAERIYKELENVQQKLVSLLNI